MNELLKETGVTELEKCLNGEWYDCHAQVFVDLKTKARKLLSQYNTLPYNDNTARYKLLTEMFGSIGTNVSVGNPFICDYGRNIHIGNNVSVNMNCTFVDCNKITIGNNVLIASNVQIYNYFPLLPFSKMLSRECRRECLWALFFIVFESYSIISSNANTKKTTVFFVKAP